MSLVKVTWIVVFSLLLAGCSSVTNVSAPAGASIYLHKSDELLGRGDVAYEDSKPVWGTTTFRIEAPGCKSKILTIYRSDTIKFWRFVSGMLLFLPWYWAGDYNKSYGVELDCGNEVVRLGQIDLN